MSDPKPEEAGARRLPGDLSAHEKISRMIRVDHAGEYGAVRIYEGQLAVLGKSSVAPLLREMAEQEREHLSRFEDMIVERRVRPTLLTPLWHMAGFALGAGTALLGEKAAMACTAAVEEVIDEHYARQAAALGEDEKPLREKIEEFRADEIAHRESALAHGAESAPAYPLLFGAIKAGSRMAIWLSQRI